ncbi:MAG: RluA family pseudouridine synthase [Lentisphaeria bacterium]|nr:RluA family pseudouridine synthase [Lentisphaeria bacterium]
MKNGFEDISRRVIRSAVDWSNAGNRLIDYLAGRFTYRSAGEWRDRIADGEILLNGEKVSPETLLKQHDMIEYFPGDIPEPPADLSYKTVYEDDTLLVIDKPGNLCVHPAGPFFKHTLWYLLCQKYGRIHIVNRLDRETSGLLIAAKTPEAAAKLGGRNWEMRKEYLALVFGEFGEEEIDAKGFLIPDTSSIVRKKRRFVFELPPEIKGIESARTILRKEYIVSGGRSVVRAIPQTGRLHQIRATLYSLGFPMVGDKLYGPDERIYLKIRNQEISDEDRQLLQMERQALHSAALEFKHPVSGEIIKTASPLPEDFPEISAISQNSDLR